MKGENLEFSLGIKNLNDLPFHKYEKNFSFIVNGKEYKTNRFIADMLSPIVRNLHYNDETLDAFSFNTKHSILDGKIEIDYFNDFLNLSQFQTVNMDKNRMKVYSEYFCHLGNLEEYFRLRSDSCQEFSKEDAVYQLVTIIEMLSTNHGMNKQDYESYKSTIDELIKFIASNFEDIDKGQMKELKYDIIEEIISSESLKLRDEDTLLQFILDLYDFDHDYSNLFKYVIFSNISDGTFKNFIEKLDIDNLNEKIWKLICNRILLPREETIKGINQNRYIENVQKFEYQKGREFQGIMQYLTEKTGGNIHDNGTIKIDSNSLSKNNYHPKNLIDFNNDNNYYHSNNDILSEIYFDFKDKKIQLTDYSIKSYDQESYTGHIKDWAIDVSNDGKNWDTIDTHKNDNALNGPNIIATFSIQKKDSEFSRFVRFRQTGPNWNGRNCNFIYFSTIEFYGNLKSQ
ncbi:hypothetical protein M9Y10_022268 [Tritrichomonas musculus]|uniref:F5/8 type C domain-containing protein n=1 Tax=Tritrichomonas musculus TaxID=1915356 RepID=A0ABR2KRY4_9EUKA